MTYDMDWDTFNDCVNDLITAAREIIKDDPDLLTGQFVDFARVMWPDDFDRERRHMDAVEYTEALKRAWELLRRDT
jgi:hypothetical protein